MFTRICPLVTYGLITVFVCLGYGGKARAADVTVFAAASLKNALDEIEARFETETGYQVSVSLAGSSLLARQIELGAPADIYLPASPDWMDYLETQGHIATATRQDLLANRLVLIAPKTSAVAISGFEDPALMQQLGQGRVAMALTEAVPAGIYGKQALQTLGVWAQLAPQIAQTDNVRAALALVAVGAAPLGVVYASDANADPRVTVLAEFPADTHPQILYPVAQVLPADRDPVAAFHSFLVSQEATDIFVAAGFEMVAE